MKEYLFDIIKEGLDGVPLLVMANKQDDPTARSKEEIMEELELTKITDREWCKFDTKIVFSPPCLLRRKCTSLSLLQVV